MFKFDFFKIGKYWARQFPNLLRQKQIHLHKNDLMALVQHVDIRKLGSKIY